MVVRSVRLRPPPRHSTSVGPRGRKTPSHQKQNREPNPGDRRSPPAPFRVPTTNPRPSPDLITRDRARIPVLRPGLIRPSALRVQDRIRAQASRLLGRVAIRPSLRCRFRRVPQARLRRVQKAARTVHLSSCRSRRLRIKPPRIPQRYRPLHRRRKFSVCRRGHSLPASSLRRSQQDRDRALPLRPPLRRDSRADTLPKGQAFRPARQCPDPTSGRRARSRISAKVPSFVLMPFPELRRDSSPRPKHRLSLKLKASRAGRRSAARAHTSKRASLPRTSRARCASEKPCAPRYVSRRHR